MATFTVEDGTVVAGANSLVDTQYLIDYMASRGVDLSTTAVSDLQVALVRATAFLERYTFKGRIVSSEQELAWPRVGVYDNNHRLLASDEIPVRIKKAVCEIANHSLTTDIFATTPKEGVIKNQSIRLGPLQQQVTYSDQSFSGEVDYPLADIYLKGLTTSSGARAIRG